MTEYEIAKQALSEEKLTSWGLEMEVQKHPSIEEVSTFAIQSISSWMTSILSFLQDGHLSQDVEEARKRAAKFTILNKPYLKCFDEEEAKYILEEIHEGICGDHAAPKSLVSKVIRTGYFWPTLQVDARELVKKCDKCQKFRNVQCLPTERLTTIASLWPFTQWGIDIIGPLPRGKRQVKFLSIAIDYFTKWVKAKALSTIIEVKIQGFIWKNIICRFGIPRMIVSDNGLQFDSQGFRDFCLSLRIKNQYSSLRHP